MGSLNEFGWLSTENVTFLQQAIETRYEIPLRLMARGFSSLIARKNFDSAQDDIQWFCLQICVRDGRFVNRPYFGPFSPFCQFSQNILPYFFEKYWFLGFSRSNFCDIIYIWLVLNKFLDEYGEYKND